MLPLAAALGVLLIIFALAAAPTLVRRATKPGFAQPLLNPGLIGVITLLIIPVQMLLVAFALRGFNQGWNVEVERRDPAAGGAGPATVPARRATTATRRRSRPELAAHRSRPDSSGLRLTTSPPHRLNAPARPTPDILLTRGLQDPFATVAEW